MAEPTCPERLARMIDWIVAEATAALTYRRSEVASNDVSAASEIADCSSEIAFPTGPIQTFHKFLILAECAIRTKTPKKTISRDAVVDEMNCNRNILRHSSRAEVPPYKLAMIVLRDGDPPEPM